LEWKGQNLNDCMVNWTQNISCSKKTASLVVLVLVEGAQQIENIVENIHRATKLLEKSDQLWTQRLEDGSLQELEGKEDKLHAEMADVTKQ
jgi:hypothetical protein